MSNFETANRLAVLNGTEIVNWQEQASFIGAPSSGSSGISVLASQVAIIAFSMRRFDVANRQASTSITFDGATTYTVNIDGNAVATAGNTDLKTTLQDIADDINADVGPGAGDIVTATAVDTTGDGNVDQVKLVGKAEADYSLVISVAGGAGTITAVADPTDGSFRVFRRPSGLTSTAIPPSWRKIDDGVLVLQGKDQNYNVGGMERLYVEYHGLGGVGDSGTITYSPRADIGPGIIP